MANRPLETLKGAVNSRVMVRTRSGVEVEGKLAATDDYMNLSLEETALLENERPVKELGGMHVKGDNLVFVVVRKS